MTDDEKHDMNEKHDLINNDDISDVTYEFSSPTIQEFPYEDVTLTATLSAVSGVDVTIPFTLSDNASTAVEVLSTEIVVLAGQQTGSVTVSTTEDLDDDFVEIIEPIVFTFGTISNATSEVTDITLNLESDDDPTITAIGTTDDIITQVEDGSFEITASVLVLIAVIVMILLVLKLFWLWKIGTKSFGFSHFYIFLYLCTLEIFPLLVLGKEIFY